MYVEWSSEFIPRWQCLLERYYEENTKLKREGDFLDDYLLRKHKNDIYKSSIGEVGKTPPEGKALLEEYKEFFEKWDFDNGANPDRIEFMVDFEKGFPRMPDEEKMKMVVAYLNYLVDCIDDWILRQRERREKIGVVAFAMELKGIKKEKYRKIVLDIRKEKITQSQILKQLEPYFNETPEGIMEALENYRGDVISETKFWDRAWVRELRGFLLGISASVIVLAIKSCYFSDP